MTKEHTKLCKGCLHTLPVSAFNKHVETKDGLRSKCIECRRLEHIEYRRKNPEKIKELQRLCDERKANNPEFLEKKRLRRKAYDQSEHGKLKNKIRQKNYKRKIRAYFKSILTPADYKAKYSNYKRWRDNNRDKANAGYALRRASKRNATPPWLNEDDKSEIVELYTACRMFKIYTGLDYHVDHMVPLINNLVCGLHIPSNLRVVPAFDNLSKNNKFDESLGIDYSAEAYR